MYKVKNLTNSPYRIATADGGFGVLPARGEQDFDIHPRMVQPYSATGYMKVTKLDDDRAKGDAGKVLPNIDEDEQKETLIAQLKALDIKADKRSSVDKLQEKLEEALAN